MSLEIAPHRIPTQSATAPTHAAISILNPTKTSIVGNCVEWIVERPSTNGTINNLANFVQTRIACTARNGSEYLDLTRTNGGELDNVQMISIDGTMRLCTSTISPVD